MVNENNKIIAEFMELNYLSSSFLWYSTSWNWLMPVVDKIEDLDSVANFEISSSGIFINASEEDNSFEGVEVQIIGKKIDCVYKACLEFIKWYNQNGNREK